MKKSLIALALVGAFATPAAIQVAAAAEEASPHTVTGNLGLFSSYRFRGIDQTFGKPALQGGFDYAHSSGFYVGNWNSNISEYAGFPGGNLEMDLYGGYKTTFGDLGVDVGAIYYYYPGSKIGGTGSKVDNTELYLGLSWKALSFKYSYAVSDYFDLAKKTDGTQYFDLSTAYDLGDGWGLNAHVGYADVKGVKGFDYTDWKIGVTKNVGGFVVGLSYIDTDADKAAYTWTNASTGKTIDAGKGVAVLSVSKSF